MKPARPYICLLIILVLVLTPSVRPLWNGRVTAAMAAVDVQVQAAGEGVDVGQVRGAAVGRSSPGAWPSFAGSGLEQGGEGADQAGEAGHLRAGGGQPAEQLLLAVAEGVWPGEQEPGDATG